VLARESKQLLAGETADAEVVAALRATVGAHPKVRRIFVRPEPRPQDSAAPKVVIVDMYRPAGNFL